MGVSGRTKKISPNAYFSILSHLFSFFFFFLSIALPHFQLQTPTIDTLKKSNAFSYLFYDIEFLINILALTLSQSYISNGLLERSNLIFVWNYTYRMIKTKYDDHSSSKLLAGHLAGSGSEVALQMWHHIYTSFPTTPTPFTFSLQQGDGHGSLECFSISDLVTYTVLLGDFLTILPLICHAAQLLTPLYKVS